MTHRGYIPKAPIVTVIDGQAGTEALVADVQHAQATADNARQMVLNRDPKAASLDQRVADLETLTPKSVKQIEYRDAVAVPAVPLVIISASVDVTVTWATPFPDTDYIVTKPAVTTSSVTLLGKTDAVIKSKTAAGVVVTVTTTAVLSLGSLTLSVLAYKRNG